MPNAFYCSIFFFFFPAKGLVSFIGDNGFNLPLLKELSEEVNIFGY